LIAWGSAWDAVRVIEGLLGDGGALERWLFERARLSPPGAVILELGAYLGRSTCCLGFGCVGTTKHVYSIDTFCGAEGFPRHEDYYDDWSRNVESCDLSDYVTGLRGLTSSFYESWEQPIDFLFMDSSHTYEVVVADFDAFFPHVVQGGCVAVHDVVLPGDTNGHPGTSRAWYEHIAPRLQYVDNVPILHGYKV